MTTEILLGPVLTDGATAKVKDKKTGKIYYRKQILPEGKYTYKTADGKDLELDLTADKIKTYIESFKARAYDEVPFQFGAHDNDPTKRKGTLAEIEHVPGKGAWGYFELDDEAAKYVEKYPKFGVSPRLVLNLERMDGKKFSGAIQHVAGTVVPRAPGMSPWEKIELSEDETPDGVQIFDFSDETIKAHKDGKEGPVTTKTTGQSGDGQTSITLSDDEYNFLKKMREEWIEAERLLSGDGEKKTGEEEKETSTVDLSEVTGKADAALAAIAEMRTSAIRDAWVAKKQLLLSQGVPPAALDLADPVMTAVESQVYDLSTDEGSVKVDAKTQMLGQLELMKGMVDLSGEKGHGITGVGSEGENPDELAAWLSSQGV